MLHANYQGYVDHLSYSQVVGWVLNGSEPNHATFVYVKTNYRLFKLRPWLPRLDVRELFGGRGLYGFDFQLPQDQIARQLGQSGSHEKILGAYFQNGRAIPPQAVDQPMIVSEQPLRYFLHIQKTAGTSLRKALLEVLPRDQIAFIYKDLPGMPVEDFAGLATEQLARLRVVYGHFQFGQLEDHPFPVRYYTVLREPRQRLRSYILHLSRSLNLPWEDVLGQQIQAMQNGDSGPHLGLDNYYVRCLTGSMAPNMPQRRVVAADFSQAEFNANAYFDAIGILERDDMPAWFARYLGLKIPALGRHNEAPPDGMGVNVEAHPLFDSLFEFNHFDTTLYKRLAGSSEVKAGEE